MASSGLALSGSRSTPRSGRITIGVKGIIGASSASAMSRCGVKPPVHAISVHTTVVTWRIGFRRSERARLYQIIEVIGRWSMLDVFVVSLLAGLVRIQGFAEITAGLGVRMTQPQGEVYVLIGDGTYLMNPTELVTALQERLKITVVLSENHGYQCIRRLQMWRAGREFGMHRHHQRHQQEAAARRLTADGR